MFEQDLIILQPIGMFLDMVRFKYLTFIQPQRFSQQNSAIIKLASKQIFIQIGEPVLQLLLHLLVLEQHLTPIL